MMNNVIKIEYGFLVKLKVEVHVVNLGFSQAFCFGQLVMMNSCVCSLQQSSVIADKHVFVQIEFLCKKVSWKQYQTINFTIVMHFSDLPPLNSVWLYCVDDSPIY